MVVVGIDLGTSNSCVGVCRGKQVEIIHDRNGNRIIPSVVTFTKEEVLVGSLAKSMAHMYTKDSVYDAKRLIGQRYQNENVQKHISECLYEVSNDNGVPKISVTYKNEITSLLIEDVSAYVLKEIKTIAENYLKCPISSAVLTVPAYFDGPRRSATKKAAILAGFDLVHIINEPTAAAIAFQHTNDKTYERKILVYDFGGGTFDVSIMSVIGKSCNVVATDGDCYLGGKDMDTNLANYVKDTIRKENGHVLGSLKSLQRIVNVCEETKKFLSTIQEYSMCIEYIDGDINFSHTITRKAFEELNEELFQRTIGIVDNCLSAAKLKVDDINEVVLVGGSSRIPRIRDILGKKFPKSSINTSLNPDEVVAYGAAIYGASIYGNKTEVLFQDVLSLSLGMLTYGDIMSTVIERNSLIPCQKSQTYSTLNHFQTELLFEVCQGESLIASRNQFLGRFIISNIRKELRGIVKILVTFSVDFQGFLTVTAVEKDTDNKRELRVNIIDGPENEKDEKAAQMKMTKEEERKYVDFALKRNAFEYFCEDLQLELKNSRIPEGDVFRRIDLALERSRSLESDDILVLDELKTELQVIADNIKSK